VPSCVPMAPPICPLQSTHTPGHTEGLTHLCARGDGRHLISNAKDQTIKLWDVRTLVSPSAAASGQMTGSSNWPRVPGFDYRWQQYPGEAPWGEGGRDGAGIKLHV
jgi:WD40 repeat protein